MNISLFSQPFALLQKNTKAFCKIVIFCCKCLAALLCNVSHLIPQCYLPIIVARRSRREKHLGVSQDQHFTGSVRLAAAFLQT